MTTKNRASAYLAAIVCAALACAMQTSASAQSAASPDKAARKPGKPAAAKRPAAPPQAAAPNTNSDYWKIEYALPDKDKYSGGAPDQSRSLGRVPLQNAPGTVGFTSQPVHTGQFGDGRTVPGHDTYTQRESSYVGLSLSVPSTTNGFPIPVPTPWNRTE